MLRPGTKVYVTGATGLIGRRLVRLLIEQQMQVTCVARDRRKLEQLAHDLPVSIIEADVRDRGRIRQTIAGHTAVFHLAAWFKIGVPRGRECEMEAINVTGTRN